MVGVIYTDDDFSTLALNANLSGRLPPVANNSSTYGVDPSVTAIQGGGSSTIKFNVIGANFKYAASSENVGVQLIFNDNGGDERVTVFLRDQQSTPAQRYGFWVRFSTREIGANTGSPYFRVALANDYTSTVVGPDVPWVFATNGINKVAFEAQSTNYRVIINDVVAYTFTQTSWAPNGIRTRCGVTFNSAVTGTSVMRGTRFTIYDSIAAAPAATEYPIVRFG